MLCTNMQDFKKEIISKLEEKYGKLQHNRYIYNTYDAEGRYSNEKISVVYESNRLFQINIKLKTISIDILDPKESSIFNSTFFDNFDVIDKSLMSLKSLSDFLEKNNSRLKNTSPIKFSFRTEHYIFSVVEESITCSLIEHSKYGTIVIKCKKDMIKDMDIIKKFFDSLL